VNPPKCSRNDFINFLITSYKACSCSEASRCLPSESEPIAHDSVKRLLERQPHHTEELYTEAKRMIRHDEGILVIDDSSLDKTYAREMDLVTRHWSGKHHLVVQGINLISIIWTDGSAIIPVDPGSITPRKTGRTRTTISGT
jgi:putative transposase